MKIRETVKFFRAKKPYERKSIYINSCFFFSHTVPWFYDGNNTVAK